MAIFLVDQCLHLASMIAATQLFLGLNGRKVWHTLLIKFNIDKGTALELSSLSRASFIICMIMVVTVTSGYFIQLLLDRKPLKGNWTERKVSIEINTKDIDERKLKTEESFTNMEDYIQSRGKIIGYLERIAVMILAFKGATQAIGFIITAKSFFRFKQLDNREWAEYFLVGTLASTLIGFLCGYVLLMFW